MFSSSRCFVCRQSKQQLEAEQRRSLYGLESTGNVAGPTRPWLDLQSGASGLAPPTPAPSCLQGHLLPLQLQAECVVAFARLWGKGDFVEGPVLPRPSELLLGRRPGPCP